MIEMDPDFAEEEVVENPTLKAAYNLAPLHQNQPLRWDHKVDLLGEKIYDKIIHLCEICELPILLYGRTLPCKHVFCFDCAVKCERICKRCGNKIQKVEKSALGTVFVCIFGAPKHDTSGCRRTYLSLRDLQSHVAHRHVPKTTAESKSTHSTSLTSSHAVNLQLPLTQQQAAAQQAQQSGVGVHSVQPPLQSSVSILQTTGHSGSHSQQHSPAMPPAVSGGPPLLSPRASPMVQVAAPPTSNPVSGYHPYGAPINSGSDQSVYRPLDMAPFSQKQQQHQILPQQPPQIQHHIQQHPTHKQDIGLLHSSHTGLQGGLHQGHTNLQHDISRRHEIQSGHGLPGLPPHGPQAHNLPPGGTVQQGVNPQGINQQGINPQDHHMPQRHNIQGANTQGDSFLRNDFQPGMPQSEFLSERNPPRHDYPSEPNTIRRDYQIDHNAPRNFQHEQNLPRRDFPIDNNFGREHRQEFQSEHNAPRPDFQDETKFTRPDFHDNDMRMGQGSHPPHNALVPNIVNTSRAPYSQNSQMPLLSNQRQMSPTSHGTHSSHQDVSHIPGNKNIESFNSSQNSGSGSRNLITVPIQDEGQYRPLPFVNPSQGNSSYSQTHPQIQNPSQTYPQSNNPTTVPMFPNSRSNNQNQMGSGPIYSGGNNSQNISHNSQNLNFNHGGNNQGPRLNTRPNMIPNRMPGMMQSYNRPPGGGMMGNPRNQGPNNPRPTGQAGSPRFNSGNRWTGPRGIQPRMSQTHPRTRGDAPRGNYYKN